MTRSSRRWTKVLAWHPPFAHHRARQLTCARGHVIMVSREVPRAWSVGLGIGRHVPVRNRPPDVPREWTHAVPNACLEPRN